MRDKSIDEFEAIFERASIPVLDIEEIELRRVSAVVDGGPLDDTILSLAAHLSNRFTAAVRLHWPSSANAEAVREAARAKALESEGQSFATVAELVGQISIGRSQLVLLPVSDPRGFGDEQLDQIIQGAGPPVLVVRAPLDDPKHAFRRILHSLTGNFRQKQNFAHSFTLAEDAGEILLLHTIDAQDIETVRDALQVSPDVADKGEAELLESLAHHGERYLKGVVAASRSQPFPVSYRLTIGEVVPTVRAELQRGGYDLLVIGTHEHGHSHVSAADYQLLHVVRDIPVLAL